MAWSILGLYVFLPDRMGAIFGQLTGNHPLFYLAVYAPAIAAFILVAHSSGIAGLRLFLGRALLWRCSVSWYAFLIIGIPLIFIGSSSFRGKLLTEPFPFTYMLIAVAALIVWRNRKDMFTRDGAVVEK